MDKKIVSTTYVPLQPPFQIIRYSTDIAMQIGTLIVTIQNEGNVRGLGYEIETHSHPVVSYENKFKTKSNHQLTAYQFLEGAVWNFVEVKDVTTICLSNSRLPWQEFIDFLRRDVERRSCVALPTIGSYWSLVKLCGGVEPPKNQEIVIHLEMYHHKKNFGDFTPAVRSRVGDSVMINAEATDKKEMVNTINTQILKYALILFSPPMNLAKFTIRVETDDAQLRKYVKSMHTIVLEMEPSTRDPKKYMDFCKTIEKLRKKSKI